MASSIVHLAITNELAKQISFADTDRLKFGAVIVDGGTGGNINGNSHLKVNVLDGRKRTYDFDRFRELFGERMLSDDLYLGYYLHLVQDSLYRHFVYDIHHWNPRIPGNTERLHNDYRLVNRYIIDKYGLKNDLKVPENFDGEDLCRISSFDTEGFMKNMEEFFAPVEEEPIFFFTKEMSDEFISEAVAFCKEEVEKLRRGEPGIDMLTYAWSRIGIRTDKDMMDLILNVASDDPRIRAVFMNGSRTNVNAPKDKFQDFDIVYVVSETASFIADKDWPGRFGDVSFMQYPDESPNFPSDKENSYAWLMVFTDGMRLDLTVNSIEYAKKNVLSDSLCKVLLDKDGILPSVPPSSDVNYHVKKPTPEQYAASCNEFWWCLNNVAKGLWREEIPYVQDMLNFVVRKELERMLSWKVGVLTEWSVSVGKSGKYMYRWLSKEEWDTYLSTYCGGNIESYWKSVEIMCAQFLEVSEWVAEKCGFCFNRKEADNSFYYFKNVKGEYYGKNQGLQQGNKQ